MGCFLAFVTPMFVEQMEVLEHHHGFEDELCQHISWLY